MLKGEASLIIKKLESEDLVIYNTELVELLIDTYIINFKLPLEQIEQICKEKIEQLANYINQGSAIVLASIKENELLGFIWLYKNDTSGEQSLHVNQIAVNKKHRGKKVGKQLMLEAEKQALQEGIYTIDLFVYEINSTALGLYNKLGFETEKRYMKKKL